MDDKNKILEICILYKNRSFTVPYKRGLKIEEVKKQCQTNFELEEKDNIILLYMDENMDKIIINNLDELLIFKRVINKPNFLVELIVEINQEINYMNKLKMKNDNLDEKDKIIIELKKEIENLKKKFESYEKKIKKNINTIESTNRISIFNKEDKIKEEESKVNQKETDKKENNNKIYNEIKENKIDKNNHPNFEIEEQIDDFRISRTFELKKLNFDINDDIIQNDKSLKKEIPIEFEDIEFINEKCLKCKNKCDKKIYKDYTNKKICLCENCFKKDIKKNYKDNYFVINFPKNLIKLINERKLKGEKLKSKPILDFNKFFNNIFFDNEGNFSKKEINEISDKDFSELKKIFEDMKLINEEPIRYFADYQVTFINKQKLEVDDNERNLIDKKLKLVLDIFAKITKK